MELNRLTIKEARLKLDNGEISALELAEACLKRIKEIDGEIHACLSVDEPGAILAAKKADERLASGEKGGLLGVPYLCKDNIMTKGLKTTAASRILEDYISPFDATVIKKLQEAGAVLLGKTNLDEFAHGASTENSAFGLTKNPHDPNRVAGGSSGGSAAAVAADMCLFALGSDTGGSIRQPASFCGVVGLKPSYGRVSRFGLLSMPSSTDVIGPLAKTVEDAAFVLRQIAGVDGRDATTSPQAVPDYAANLSKIDNRPLSGLKVALPKEYYIDGLDNGIKEKMSLAAKILAAAGAEIKEVSLPYTNYGIPVYYIITPSEISSNLARFDGIGWGLNDKEAGALQDFYKSNRSLGFGREAKRRIMLGTYALSAGYYDAYYKKAQSVRTLIIEDFDKVFTEADLILTPTSPHPAFKIGSKVNDPLAMYLEDIFVTGASLAGLPAISVPSGQIEEEGSLLPVGAQIIAPRFNEEKLLMVAAVLEAGV